MIPHHFSLESIQFVFAEAIKLVQVSQQVFQLLCIDVEFQTQKEFFNNFKVLQQEFSLYNLFLVVSSVFPFHLCLHGQEQCLKV